ncbi:dTMP kinase [Candidatus Marinimicrobia bacterium]|nr:dTMP kinase [Candidatus Neomarinimicrobiota bacterium]
MTKNYFITFEGIDGSGKSTQAKILVEKLQSLKLETLFLREPGGTSISEEIRSVLLNNREDEMSSRSEALLMCASRAQLTKDIISPELKAGKWIVADRYADSTLAYQGGGRGLNLDWLIKLNQFATYGIEPDLTFYIDIEPEVGFQRRKGLSSDRIESAGLDFQNDIRQKYLEIVDNFGDRCVIIDGNLSVDKISNYIWNVTRDRTLDEVI